MFPPIGETCGVLRLPLSETCWLRLLEDSDADELYALIDADSDHCRGKDHRRGWVPWRRLDSP